ncbi:hypothetical protein Cantr_07209 [Candida viswanathii]|uniref:Uncharacterized protein n=1 Tax=Candida viswanathii TaxID=5486 RepID=A0A367Y0S3_9ASCO|nr:hypothetical protein Cantr_07209 [Candida viswanathii]
MEELIHKIQTSDNLLETLNKLGDELREEHNRAAIHAHLPTLIPQFSKFLLQPLPKLHLETLRVVINVLANSDANRDFFTDPQDSHVRGFWDVIAGSRVADMDDVTKFVFIMLGQFIYDAAHKLRYVAYLYDVGVVRAVCDMITEETWRDIGEFVYEALAGREMRSGRDREFLRLVVDMRVDEEEEEGEGEDEEDEEMGSVWVDLIGLNKPSNEIYNKVLEVIPAKNSSLIKRKLFALASELAVDESLTAAIDVISTTSDSYVFAACCITIGNCIYDKPTFEATRTAVDNQLGIAKLAALYFDKNKVSDVVQIQSIHMWTNLLDTRAAQEITTSYQSQLLAITKIVLDNSDYYKEITALYFKFIKKLIRLSGDHKSMPSNLVEFILDNDKAQQQEVVIELKYLLLQLYPEQYAGLVGDVVQSVNTRNVLEQLKTVAIVNNALRDGTIKLDKLEEAYLVPLGRVLSQLLTQLDTQGNETWEFKAFQNNLKYVAATTLGLVEEGNSDLVDTCNRIIERS